MGVQPTLTECLPIIKLIKKFGLFPYAIVHLPETLELTTSTSRKKHLSLKIDTSWKTFCLCIFVQSYFGARLVFGFGQILWVTFFDEEYRFYSGISAFCTNLIGTCAFGITFVSNRNKNQLIRLLNEWEHMSIEMDSFIARKNFTE